MAQVTVTPDPTTLNQDIDGLLTTGFLFGALDGASSTLFNYLDAANGIFIEVIGTGMAYNGAGTEVTAGTVNTIRILKDFGGNTAAIGVFSGFSMDAAALDAAVRDFRLTTDPAQWHALFGQNDFNVLSSQWNLNFRGFAGDDTVQGGDGNDIFGDFDGGDLDVFNGGNGDDNSTVGLGVSHLDGGAGFDFLSFFNLASPAASGVSVNTATGLYSSAAIAGLSGTISNFEYIIGTNFNDAVLGRAASEYMIGEAGNDLMRGFGGVDRINAGDGNDTVQGGDGNDVLLGGIGNDRLSGDNDIDFLTGENGADILTGGLGKDTFIYNQLAESGTTSASRDRIADFVHLTDLVNLANIDANANAAGNQAFIWKSTAAFSGAAGELRYATSASGATVFGDVDGNKAADFAIFMSGVTLLSDLDFKL